MTATDDRHERYGDYEACLVALRTIPENLAGALAAAEHAYDGARKAADEAYRRQGARLDDLVRDSRDRYAAAVAALAEHDVALPRKVRAAVGIEGDESSLRLALEGESADAAAVVAALREADSAARGKKADAARRAAEEQRAQEALRARRAKVLSEREATEARRREAAAAAAARSRRRRRIAIAAVAALVALAAVITVTVIVINH